MRSYPAALAVPDACSRWASSTRRKDARPTPRTPTSGCWPPPRRATRIAPGPSGAWPLLRGAAALGPGPGRLRPGPRPLPRRAPGGVRHRGEARRPGRRAPGARPVRPRDRRPDRARHADAAGPPLGARGHGDGPAARGRRGPPFARRQPHLPGAGAGPPADRPGDGPPPWSADLGGEPIWVGYLDDKVIAATESRVVALGLDDGAIAWRNDLDVRDPARRRSGPVRQGRARVARARGPSLGSPARLPDRRRPRLLPVAATAS